MRLFTGILALLFIAVHSVNADFTQVVRAKKFAKIKIKTDQDVSSVTALKYMPKQIWLASAGHNLVCIWDCRNFEQKKRFYNESFGKINALAVDGDARFAYFCGGEPGEKGLLFRLSLEDGAHETIAQSGDEFFALSHSPNANLLAAGSMNGELFVIDCTNAALLLKTGADGGKIVSLDFSPDGETLAIAYADGRICARSKTDGFKTPSADINSRSTPIALKFMNPTTIAIAAGYGTDSKIITFGRFLERTRKEIETPNFNAAAFYTRKMTHPFVLAGSRGSLNAYKNSPIEEPLEYESVNMRFECADRGGANNPVAGGEKGRIVSWQNHNGMLIGGIVIQDREAKDYAVWTVRGDAYSTRKDSIEFLDNRDNVMEKTVDFLNKEKTEAFLKGKNFPVKKDKPKPEGKS